MDMLKSTKKDEPLDQEDLCKRGEEREEHDFEERGLPAPTTTMNELH